MIKNITVIAFAILFSFGNAGFAIAQEVNPVDSTEEIVVTVEETTQENEESVNEVETSVILSCEDIFTEIDLSLYRLEFDGDPDCSYVPEVTHLSHYNIFPGESVEDVIMVSVDGVEYSLADAPNITIQTIDKTVGFATFYFSFPYNFPNYEGGNPPAAVGDSLFIELTFHTSCDTILSSTQIATEYFSRFNPDFSLDCRPEEPTINVQDEVTIEKGSDLLTQITVTIDGVEYTISDLDFFAVLDGFTSENTGNFVVSVGAGKDGVNTVEDVDVIVVDSTVQEPTSTGGSSGSGGGGSSSGTLIGGNTGGQVLGAFDTATTGEVLGESTTNCPAFSSFHKKGDKNGEVNSIQSFLNTHMSAGLAMDGIYGPLTEKAVHAFQQKYWEQTIKPWTPALSSRTTGRWYKTTNAWANVLSGCAVEPIFIEDTNTMYTPSLTESQA